MCEEIGTLAAQIEATFPGATTEIESFPSGAIMLDVRWRGRLFVMAYTSRGGFGVDEVGDEEGFETGYQFCSNDLHQARDDLSRLLRSVDYPQSTG
jgi:hypothetical protein